MDKINHEQEKENEVVNNMSPDAADHFAKLHPVVAIGASAGGLQALTELFENLPDNLGMSYVIIQHLSPNHESILPELLEKSTRMPVDRVSNNMRLKPDHVYVIPPNTFMSIVDSTLTLSERVKSDGSFHAIDFFFNALAPEYQTKAIAIILSGSGTDGTLGISSIKAYGGISFVQDESATFQSMPKTAANSGYVDFVLPCKRIAEELAALVKNPFTVLTVNEVIADHQPDLKKIQLILHNRKGVDFSFYKQTTINRRILRRMGLNRLLNLNDYIKLLRENPREVDLLYNDLLINVTAFFREPAVYAALVKKIFPSIVKTRKNNDPLRIWAPACATGEETFSIAMCLLEYLGDKALNIPIQIFGTDLSEPAIDGARTGIYTRSNLVNVSEERLNRFFVKTDGSYQIAKSIRDMCIFATHNLLTDPPFSRMDLISCQNVMIYLETNPQKKILQAFHYALKPTGFLLLGKSETIGNSTELFAQVDKDMKLYSKKLLPFTGHSFNFSMQNSIMRQSPPNYIKHPVQEQSVEEDIEREVDKLLLSKYVPASVLVNSEMQILRFNGPTSNYLQPAAGKASLNLLKMIKDELIFELKGLINQVKKEGVGKKRESISIAENGELKQVSMEVVPLKSSPKEPYFLVLFMGIEFLSTPVEALLQPKRKKEDKDAYISRLQQQLEEASEYMKSMSEEFEATREELQSANEEVLSSNEELQSINEELETSKEELQSTNEELTTINDELQRRNDDLKEAVDNSQAIIETIIEPIIVLSLDMKVRRANKAFYNVFKTRPENAEGLNLFEMENGQWNIPELRQKLENIVSNNVNFQDLEVTRSFPVVGERTLKFNAMRMVQDNNRQDRVLLTIDNLKAIPS